MREAKSKLIEQVTERDALAKRAQETLAENDPTVDPDALPPILPAPDKFPTLVVDLEEGDTDKEALDTAKADLEQIYQQFIEKHKDLSEKWTIAKRKSKKKRKTGDGQGEQAAAAGSSSDSPMAGTEASAEEKMEARATELLKAAAEQAAKQTAAAPAKPEPKQQQV